MTDLGDRTVSETFGTTSPVTGSAPTLATDGLFVGNTVAAAVVIRCPASQTLSGAGTLDCYTYDHKVESWARAPGGDFDVDTSGVRTLGFDAVDVLCGRSGRVKWVPNGVTFSGGSTGLELFIVGQAPGGDV